MNTTDITGRDGFIGTKALVYAIACIQNLPRRWQEGSDMTDMALLARSLTTTEGLAQVAIGVESHMRVEIEMFPDLEHDDIDAARTLYEFHISKLRAQRSAWKLESDQSQHEAKALLLSVAELTSN
jgi:hypothetical protein